MEKTFKIITSDNTSIDAESLANAIGFAYDYGDKLKVEEVASRDSRILSAVPSEFETEKFTVRKHPDLPDGQKNVIWVEKHSGEGMTVSLDRLWMYLY